jgi:uncharacterized protein YgbK (DUF1537 family)
MATPLQPASVCIIADDLTGACDASVAFACVGMTTEVEPAWDMREDSTAQVVAYNTESRDIPTGESTARIREAASRLAASPTHHIFKKVDSVFRGNTYTEIAAVLAAIPHDLAILAPAFPELGRTVVDGQLHTSDLSGKQTVAILTYLRDAGVDAKAVSDLAAIRPGPRLLLCDSQTSQDLHAIVGAALALETRGRILWIGSGGLAHALAASIGSSQAPACPTPIGGKVLFVVGSDHPVTLLQLQHLRLAVPEAIVLPVPRAITFQALQDQITPHLSQGIACLFATGGDTALAVCHALKIHRLQIQCEFARGLPQSRIVGGPLEGTTFILKSGGFGEESVLSRIAQTFAP